MIGTRTLLRASATALGIGLLGLILVPLLDLHGEGPQLYFMLGLSPLLGLTAWLVWKAKPDDE